MHQPIAHDFDIRDLTQHDSITGKPFYKFLRKNVEKLSGFLIQDLTFYLTGSTMTKEASDEYMRHSMVGMGSETYSTLQFVHSQFWYACSKNFYGEQYDEN